MNAEPLIRTRALSRSFTVGRATVRALSELDLSIERGSFVAILGPSGSGKSTLLHLLGGLDRPSAGSVEVAGQSLTELDEDSLAAYRRRRVGFIFQSFHLMPRLTALENVALPLRFSSVGRRERRLRAMHQLELVGLADRAMHKPGELSGGELQRVAIARSMVNQPELLLGDEPTGNLDSGTGLRIMESLSQLNAAGRTVIVVSHDPRITGFASDTLFLLDGRRVSEADYSQAISFNPAE